MQKFLTWLQCQVYWNNLTGLKSGENTLHSIFGLCYDMFYSWPFSEVFQSITDWRISLPVSESVDY